MHCPQEMSGYIKSGSQLLATRKRDSAIPSIGEKFLDMKNISFLNNQIILHREKLKFAIDEPIVSREDTITKGLYNDDLGYVQLINGRHKLPHHIGMLSNGGPCLYPEEALCLMHCGELEITFGDMPLSLQAAYSILLQNSHWNYILTYNFLSSISCKIRRHQPHLHVTKYEKKLNLNQGSLNFDWKKKKHLSLNQSTGSLRKISNHSWQIIPPVAVPDVNQALEDFYSSLDDTSKQNSPKSVKNSAALDKKKRKCLEQFTCMAGRNSLAFDVEDVSLLPDGAIPQHSSYTVSQSALNYYSKYDESFEKQPHYFSKKRKGFDNSYSNVQFQRRKYRQNDNFNHWNNYNKWDIPQCSDDYNTSNSPNSSFIGGDLQCFRPTWKVKKKTFDTDRGSNYPSALVRSVMNNSNSWKEYKGALASATEGSLLKKQSTGILWKGRSTPLIKPSEASTIESLLEKCVLSKEFCPEDNDIISRGDVIEPIFDVYLPSVSFKPSDPPPPSGRVFIPKNGELFNPRQILKTLGKYDDVPSIFTSIITGTPRLMCLTPIDATPQ